MNKKEKIYGWQGRIAALLFACILIFILEGAAYLLSPPRNALERIFAVLEQDALLFWRQKPHLNVTFEGSRVKTNSRGFRDKEILPKKNNGTFRIICLGASPTFGWGVGQQQTYSYQLGELLKKRFSPQRDIEVINAGMIGYSSYQGMKFLKDEIVKLAPDVITVSYVINDVDKHRFFRSNGKMDKALGEKNRAVVQIENFLDKSSLVRILRKIIVKYQPVASQYFGKTGTGRYLEARRVSPEDYQENLKAIVDTARQHDIAVVFVKMPVNLPQAGYVPVSAQTRAEQEIEQALVSAGENRYKEAVAELKKALADNPSSSKAYYYLGQYYERLKDLDRSRESFREAIKMELFECAQLGKKYNAIMQQVADSENVISVDIVSEYNEFNKKDSTYLFLDAQHDTIHPNSMGHMIISKAIYKALVDHSLVN